MFAYQLLKVLGLLLIPGVIYFIWKKFFNVAKIPGMKPSHPKNGNLGELAGAGSLHQFLVKLHTRYGDIASFWMGQDYVVSTASPALFKQQAKLFDRPVAPFKMFEILITPESIQYANGTDGKRRREIYDPVYSHQAVTENHLPIILAISESMVDDFDKQPSDEHIELDQKLFHFSMKSIFETSLGRAYRDKEQVNALKTHYDVCWAFIEEKVVGVVHSTADQKKFDEHRAAMMKIVHDVIDERKKEKNGTLLIDTIMSSGLPDDVVAADVLSFMLAGAHTTGLYRAAMMKIVHDVIDERKKEKNGTLLIDTIMSSGLPDDVVAADVLSFMLAGAHTTGLYRAAMMKIVHDVIDERKKEKNGTLLIDTIMSSGLPDDVVAADVLSFMLAGAHTTGLLLTWCMYYLGHNQDIQNKCYEELMTVMGPEETIGVQILNELRYIQQVMDETLRCSTLGPYAARYSDEDIILGDYMVPAKTPVIQALGVSMEDPNLWPEPERFDPDRFTTAPSTYEFVPFGFAGKRKCPGYRLAYMEAKVFLSVLLRRFKMHLAPESRKPVHKVFGLVTKPNEPIFVMLEKR